MRESGADFLPLRTESAADSLSENGGHERRAGDEIAKRKRAEAAWQASDRRFRAAFDQVAVGMVEASEDGRLRWANDQYCRITGYSREELIGRSVWEFTYSVDLPENRRRYEETVAAKQPSYTVEKRYVRKDGTLVWVRATANMVHAEPGGQPYVVGVVEEIGERKQAETALREQEQRLELALDSAEMGAWDLDLVNDDAIRSPGHDRIFGYESPRPEWGRGIFLSHVVPEDRDHVRQCFDEAANTGKFAVECRIRRTDNVVRWIAARGRIHGNDAGEPVRMLGTVRDITEQTSKERIRRFLLELSEATQPLADPAAVLSTTARLLGEHLRVNRCAYASVEEDEDHFVITRDHPLDTFSMVGRFAMSAFGGQALRLMRDNQPYVVDDIEVQAPAGMDLTAYRQTDIRAIVCVPLHKGGRFVAAMGVHQNTPRHWSPEEIELVRVVTNRCWESLERARAEWNLRESEERLRLALDAAEMGAWEADLVTRPRHRRCAPASDPWPRPG